MLGMDLIQNPNQRKRKFKSIRTSYPPGKSSGVRVRPKLWHDFLGWGLDDGCGGAQSKQPNMWGIVWNIPVYKKKLVGYCKADNLREENARQGLMAKSKSFYGSIHVLLIWG